MMAGRLQGFLNFAPVDPPSFLALWTGRNDGGYDGEVELLEMRVEERNY